MYGEIYYHTYCIQDTDEPARLSIFKRDHVGVSTFVDAGPVPIQTGILNNDEDSIGGVYPTMAKIQLIGDEEFGMEDLYTADNTEFMVEHWVNGELDWKGYMAAETFGEEDSCGVRYLNINALDGLTLLKDFKFVDQNGKNYGVDTEDFERNIVFVLKEAFLKTGFSIPFKTQADRQVVNATINYITTTANAQASGWVYANSFNTQVNAAVGNYARYRPTGTNYFAVSRIMAVDDSDVNRGVLLSPAMPENLGGELEIGFFVPQPVTDQDVLSLATIDLRNFVEIEDDGEEGQPERNYYLSTDGTFSTWDVLDSIARLFDLRITQRQGKWEAVAVDSHRVTTYYYNYDSAGVLTGRSAGIPIKAFPENDELSYRLAGGTRFFGKVLKNVSVNYTYRYKTEGDELVNLLENGGIFDVPSIAPPNTYAPPGWVRQTLVGTSDALNVERHPLLFEGKHFLEMWAPQDTFPRNHTINPLPVLNLTQGDVMQFSMLQSLYERQPDVAFTIAYNSFTARFVGSSGKVYYLVNKEDQQGWNQRFNTSPNPIGQWLEEENPDIIWSFLSNYSTAHPTGTTLQWSAISRINVTMDPVPENGQLQIRFSGLRFEQYDSAGRVSSPAYQIIDVEDGKFIYGVKPEDETGQIVYYKGAGNPDYRLRIGDLILTRITSEASGGKGRVYGYSQPGVYSDEIVVPVEFGDENNPDHVSVIKVNGNVHDLWQDSAGELGVGPLGLTLARSLMRRYYHPMTHLDGGYRDTLPKPSDVLDLYGGGRLFRLKTGDISHCYRLVEGSLEQLSTLDIPIGGYDRGAGSLTNGRSAGTGSSSGGGAGVFMRSLGAEDSSSKLPVGAAPSSAMATGTAGQVIVTEDYVYFCVSENTWRRTPINTW